MKTRTLPAALALAAGLGLAGCTAEVKEEGELPNVEVEGGKAPEIDVDPANVEVTTDTQKVEVPEVNVTPAAENGEAEGGEANR